MVEFDLLIFLFLFFVFAVTATSIYTHTTDLGALQMSFQVMKFDDLKELGSESAVKVCTSIL